MNLSLTVIAHGNGLAAFRRHLPLWQAHAPATACVICPTDDPIPATESPWPVIAHSLAQHNGLESRERLRLLLGYLAGLLDVTHHVIYEYDSFCLSPTITPQLGFIGNCYNSLDSGYLAPRYANPPWLIDHSSLVAMHATAQRWPDLYESGEADRWLSALAWLSSIPVLPHSPPGYSRGWITERHVASLRKAIYAGSTMLHGIKQKWTLEAALQFYDERPKTL